MAGVLPGPFLSGGVGVGALSSLIWFVALIVGGAAIVIALMLFARFRYLKSGQEEGE